MTDPFEIPACLDRRGEEAKPVTIPNRKWIMPSPARIATAKRRYRQDIRQHHGQRLQHQRIAGRPQIDVAAVGQRDPVQQGEAVLPGKEVGPYAPFFLRPVTPQRPHIGIRRIFPSPMTQPGRWRFAGTA
jgi:hypothetical protein